MATYVRVCNFDGLRDAVERTGSQRHVAELVGMSPARLNQLLVGVRPCLRIHQANALAVVCGVPPRQVFEIENADQLAPYLVACGHNTDGDAA